MQLFDLAGLVGQLDMGVSGGGQHRGRMPGQLLSRRERHAVPGQVRDVRVTQGVEVGKPPVRVLVRYPGRLQIQLHLRQRLRQQVVLQGCTWGEEAGMDLPVIQHRFAGVEDQRFLCDCLNKSLQSRSCWRTRPTASETQGSEDRSNSSRDWVSSLLVFNLSTFPRRLRRYGSQLS